MTCPVKPPASLSIQLLTQRALCEGVTRYSLTSNACRQRIHQRQHTLRHQISDIRQSRRHAAPAKAHAATAELQMLAGNSNNGSLPNSLPSSTSQKQPAKQASSNKKHAAVTKSQTESLKLLEWATVCQQVSVHLLCCQPAGQTSLHI